MKTKYKTARVTKEYIIKAFGYWITVPVGSIVTNKTACGPDDSYRYLSGTNALAKKVTGFKNSILAHDLEHRGLNIPADHCEPYGE